MCAMNKTRVEAFDLGYKNARVLARYAENDAILWDEYYFGLYGCSESFRAGFRHYLNTHSA